MAVKNVPVALSRSTRSKSSTVLHGERGQRPATARVGDHAVERAGGRGRDLHDADDVVFDRDVADDVRTLPPCSATAWIFSADAISDASVRPQMVTAAPSAAATLAQRRRCPCRRR